MVYVIISNIGLAIMMIYIYSRYSHFRIISSKEINQLRLKNEAQSNELRDFDAKFLSSIKSYQDRIENLLIEVGKVRQEKEQECAMRSEIEKKFEVLKQRNSDYEDVHSEITNAILNIVNDNHETAKNLSKDLYEKISDSYKKQLQENQQIISRINQNVAEIAHQFNLGKDKSRENKGEASVSDYSQLLKISFNPVAQNTFQEVVNILKNKGLAINKDYIIYNDEARLINPSPELVFVKGDRLHILDFKGTSYIFEYFALKAQNDKSAEGFIEFILKKYLIMLGDDSYYQNVKKSFNLTNLNYKSHQILIIIPSSSEIKLLKELQFYELARQSNIEVFDISTFSKLI